MNKFKLSTLALITSVATLTACGSGGGSSDSNSTQKDTKQQYAPNTAPVAGILMPKDQNGNPINTKKITISEVSKIPLEIDRDALPKGSIVEHSVKSHGKEIGKLAGYNRQYSVAGVIALVDDKNIIQRLLDLGNSFTIGSHTSDKGVKGALNNTWRVIPYTPAQQVFAFGDPTKYYDNIGLMKGNAVYKGSAARYDSVSGRVRHIGETTLNVNFDEKTIEGKVETDDFRRNIILSKTNIIGTSVNGEPVTQQEITNKITDINKQINDINNEINKLTQGNKSGIANAIGESAEGSNNRINSLTDEQKAQIAPQLKQIETLKKNIEDLKNTGNGFSGKAIAEENHIYKSAIGTYQGKLYGPNAEEAAGIITFDTAEDSTSFSTIKQ